MKLAKDCVDFGVWTNNVEAMLTFWQLEVGLPYEELLKIGGGVHQHRLGLNGSVFKLNTSRDSQVQTDSPTGYSTLYIAGNVSSPTPLVDPDGNKVVLVPNGWQDITRIGIHMTVRSAATARQFLGYTLQGDVLAPDRYRLGTTVILVNEDRSRAISGGLQGQGYRYLTIQVYKVDTEHAGLIERGAIEGSAARTLGKTARISFITDNDNNWIEISQRASLTGDLSPG